MNSNHHAKLAHLLLSKAPVSASMDPKLRDALLKAVSSPGKLARAALVQASIEAHGVDQRCGENLLCAIEYFHMSSLILDDLPCMDDAELRRGRPCLHRTHGEATAILASLALINRAYTLIAMSFATASADLQMQVQCLLDASLGCSGLVGGQAADLRYSDQTTNAASVLRISWRKTGGLFSLALLLPALAARASGPELQELRRLSVHWSLGYQGMDDLTDLLSSSLEAGKTTGRDGFLKRPNLAAALGVPRARARIARFGHLAGQAIERSVQLNPAWSFLREFHERNFMLPVSRVIAA